MTAPRRVLPGQSYLITRRCTQRQWLLRPDSITNRVFLYCLALAASRHGIDVFAWTAMSNHYHAVIHDPSGLLPAFLEHFHKLVAKVMNVRWCRVENFWSTEQTSVVQLVNPEDVFAKVVYVLANPVAAHVVDRVTDWPGASSLIHLAGRELVVERPRMFFRANGPSPASVSLRAVAPEGVDAASWAARVREAVAARERAAREERTQSSIPVFGRKSVLGAPISRRPSSREATRTLRPTLACRDVATRIRELAALRMFRALHRRASLSLRDGHTDVQFPPGTWRWRLLGWSCQSPAPPSPVALVL